LYVTPSSRLLGARRSLLELATNLDPARYRPVVVAQREGALVDALREAGVSTHVLFLGWWRKGRYMLARPLRIVQLARLARAERADLIHCNEFYPCPYAVRAAKRARRGAVKGGIPVVSHMRLSITPRQIRNYDLRRAARILCVSQAAARHFEVWPDWRERVEVVYNGVDLEAFRPRVSRSEARRCLELGEEDFVVGQFGLLTPRKRQHLLLRAAARLRDLPLRVLIVGSGGRSDGDYEKGLRNAAAGEELREVVRFLPFTRDIAPLYQACDVNVLISDDEGFGRTIIEAGALGVPSIGSRVGGIPELIEEDETGYLIPEDDDGALLADRLRELAQNPERRRAMGESARARVESHFSIARHAEQVMDVYDRVIGSR
ncbi:MAG TPA: glycosyltransferase family 4 protein, partial [Sumerlaeia bacterium]|nr:glycosyltransferase family 4 protein [Sumerlaeia bacterium]